MANPSLVFQTPEPHPLGKLARMVSPKLAELESHIDMLDNRLTYLPRYEPQGLQRGLGWRAGRRYADGALPTLSLDLGHAFPLSEMFLVPAQPQAGEQHRLFPRQLRIEASLDADFHEAKVLYETPEDEQEEPEGYPWHLELADVNARYLRLTVLSGRRKGEHSISTISEWLVVSGGEPVSIHAQVEATQSMNRMDFWEPRFAIDGRTPLGSGEGNVRSRSTGVQVVVPDPQSTVEWLVDLGKSLPIDRVSFHPYELSAFGDLRTLPRELDLSVGDDPGNFDADLKVLTSGETIAPVIVPLTATSGRYLRIRALKPFTIGELHIHGIAELGIWSHGRNVAASAKIIQRDHEGETPASAELTDGDGAGLKILPTCDWLRQLSERFEIESELAEINPMHRQMVAKAEMNATWGASIAVGLTFLIPIAFIERRRLVSKTYLDKIRKRIASDLHDDIGSNLGSISLIARSAQRELSPDAAPDTLRDDLTEIESISRESSLAMRDIVWLLEQRDDTLDDFVTRIRNAAERMLRGIEYQFSCDSTHVSLRMSLDAKRHLFLFFKESLHNIVKHSQATHVGIHIHSVGPHLVMEIEDDGQGLPLDEHHQPVPLRKLADRAAVLEGQLRIESKTDRGTHVRLQIHHRHLTGSAKQN